MQDGIVTRWLTREDVRLKTVSYAQNGEDILLGRAFGRDHAGFYVDVGANDPIFHSVTKLLYERGWHGVNIEPTPALHGRLVADRPRDVNLNVGIAEAEGTLTFHEVAPPLHGWSTFEPEVARAYRLEGVESVERPIAVTTLDRVFETYVGDRTVDVLKVDAEGFERQVISSLDLGRWRPRVILVEATWSVLWEHLILERGYSKAAFDGINVYYVRLEDPGLMPAFEAPVNNTDNSISHEVVRLIGLLERGSLARPPGMEPFGPAILSIAHRLRDEARRKPRLASVVKRLLRWAGWIADLEDPRAGVWDEAVLMNTTGKLDSACQGGILRPSGPLSRLAPRPSWLSDLRETHHDVAGPSPRDHMPRRPRRAAGPRRVGGPGAGPHPELPEGHRRARYLGPE